MGQWLASMWRWWGHLSNLHQLLALLGAAVALVLGFFGVTFSTAEVVKVLSSLLLALGVVALVLILYVMVASRLGVLPVPGYDLMPKWKRPPDDEMQEWVDNMAEAARQYFGPSDAELAQDPNLRWQDPTAHPDRKGFELRVVCTNTGSDAQVLPASFVSARWTGLNGEESQTERIAFLGLNTMGLIQREPGRFALVMRLTGGALPGDHEVTWRIVYKNAQMTRGYITECSCVVRMLLGQPKVLPNPALDMTGPRERYEHYERVYHSKRESGTTGTRRSDQ